MTYNYSKIKISTKVTFIGLISNVGLAVFKYIAGVIGQSSAMMADAIHSTSDLISDFMIIIGVRFSEKPVDGNHKYGHGKIETLITIIIGLMVCGAGIGIFISGLESIKLYINDEKLERPGYIAILVAFISIVVKEALYRYTLKTGQKIKSQSLIANAWHHRTDAMSSIGTFLGISGAIFLGEDFIVLDPLTALVVSIFIFRMGFVIVKENINELLDASLDYETEKKIISLTEKIEGVRQPHNLRTRKIGNKIAIEMHIYVERELSIVEAHDISKNVEQSITDEFGNEIFITIHVEPLK